MRILEPENWRVNKTSVICDHFKLTDMTGTERKRLIATAKGKTTFGCCSFHYIRSKIHFKLETCIGCRVHTPEWVAFAVLIYF
jgi:hypothetical protein